MVPDRERKLVTSGVVALRELVAQGGSIVLITKLIAPGNQWPKPTHTHERLFMRVSLWRLRPKLKLNWEAGNQKDLNFAVQREFCHVTNLGCKIGMETSESIVIFFVQL